MKHSLKAIFTKGNENKSPADNADLRKNKSAVISEICGNYFQMKTKFFLAAIMLIAFSCNAQQGGHPESAAKPLTGSEPWTEQQLMQSADLAKILNDATSKKPFIYNIGPSGLIKHAMDIGEGENTENIEKLRKELTKLPKDANIVIYCGCCPFKNCPNIRPAFNLLNEMKFTNHKLLNLSQNLKVDWIDKSYPINE